LSEASLGMEHPPRKTFRNETRGERQQRPCGKRLQTVPLVQLAVSQWPIIRTCPPVAVSEGVAAGISIDKQDDPSVFVPGPPEPVNPSVLLTVEPRLILHRRSLPHCLG